MTYLILGNPAEPCCASVAEELGRAGLRSLFIENPLVAPTRLSWHFDTVSSRSELVLEDGERIPDEQISGVLVRTAAYIDPTGWEQGDWNYAQNELRAALLGWLWSLRCPVVNRYDANLWYHNQVHPLHWHSLLTRAGLQPLPAVISNVKEEARALAGNSGAVYTPLTSFSQYLLRTEEEWSGMFTIQEYAPTCVTLPHGPALLACVVGQEVVWDGLPPDDVADLEGALVRFARSIGLSFVQVAFAPTYEGLRVITVEHQPIFGEFSEQSRATITEKLVSVLRGDESEQESVSAPGAVGADLKV